MQGTTTSRGKRIYRCIKRHSGGLCRDPARMEADVVEAYVLAEIRGRRAWRRVGVGRRRAAARTRRGRRRPREGAHGVGQGADLLGRLRDRQRRRGDARRDPPRGRWVLPLRRGRQRQDDPLGVLEGLRGSSRRLSGGQLVDTSADSPEARVIAGRVGSERSFHRRMQQQLTYEALGGRVYLSRAHRPISLLKHPSDRREYRARPQWSRARQFRSFGCFGNEPAVELRESCELNLGLRVRKRPAIFHH